MLQIIIATFYHRKKSQIVPSLGCNHKALTPNLTHLEPHPGFYRLPMKGIFDAYVL